MRGKGVFIAFEGLDGSGKTTQMQAIHSMLLGKNIICKAEREPSDGILGLIARSAVKKKLTLSPNSMALLFAADRCEHVFTDIWPHINKGVHVLTDRFIFSNLAYQGMSCSFEDLLAYNRQVTNFLMPDLTVFIDTDPEVCLDRINKTRAGRDLFDNDGVAIRKNFCDAFKLMEKTTNVLTIDGNQPKEIITGEIWKNVESLFKDWF